MHSVLLAVLCSGSATASPTTYGAVAGEFAFLANPTDGRTPSTLSVWGEMQRRAPAPSGASSVTSGGKVSHQLQLDLPAALVQPTVRLDHVQGASSHSWLGRGWRISSGLMAERPTGKERRQYTTVDGAELSEPPLDILVLSGDGPNGVLYELSTGWVWESTSPSHVTVEVETNGDLVVRTGHRRWHLVEVLDNQFHTAWVRDRVGNRVDYTWNGRQLTAIDYGGQMVGGSVNNHIVKVEFTYRPSAHSSYSSASGALETIDERLDEVQVSTSTAGAGQPTLRKSYTFTYNLADSTYADDEVLLEVREQGVAGEDRLVQRFDYSDLDLDSSTFVPDTQPRWLGQTGTSLDGTTRNATQHSKIRFEDWSHDGLPDVVDGYLVPNVNAMVRSSGPFGDVSYYNLPTDTDVGAYDFGLRPATGSLVEVESLEETEVRVFTTWDGGTQWGQNATFTTVKFVDLDNDGWLDRIRVTDPQLDTLLDDPMQGVLPSDATFPPAAGFTWEVCYADGGRDLWDYDCHDVPAPFIGARLGFAEVMPYAETGVVSSFDNVDAFVDLVDVDHDGWLDIVYQSGGELYVYDKLGDPSAPIGRRATGWSNTRSLSIAPSWDSDVYRTRSYVDTDDFAIADDAETTVPSVYLTDELSTLRDLNGDGRQDRLLIPADFGSTGMWEVWLADGDGFAGPFDWPAPAPFLGRSDEGFPATIVASVPYCGGASPWDPETVDVQELEAFEAGGWFYDPNDDPAASAKQAFEDAWAELEQALMDQAEQDLYLQEYFDGFDRINPGRPRLVISGLVDVDADGRPDFVEGELGRWYRNLGDGFDPVGVDLPNWWPTRTAKVGPSSFQEVHILESSLTTQPVFAMSHCEDDGTVSPDQVLGSNATTETKMRIMDVNGDGLLDAVSSASVRPKGITYVGGFAPQEPPGLLKQVTTNTLLQIGFDYGSSVEVYPNGHAEQAVPLMGTSLGAEMLVDTMWVQDPFQPLITPDPQVPETPVGRWARHYTYDTPICRDGRCWGFDAVLMEDELLQRAPGSNQVGDTIRAYTDTTYHQGSVLGPRVDEEYVGEGLHGEDDRYHTKVDYNPVPITRLVAWPDQLDSTESREHPSSGVRTQRSTRTKHTHDGFGNLLTVAFDPLAADGTVQPGPESVRQETHWVSDSHGVLFVPTEQWLYDQHDDLVEHARYAYDQGSVGDAPTDGHLTSQEIASGPSGSLDSEWLSWAFTFDGRGQVATSTLPNGLLTAQSWDLFGGTAWSSETVTGDFGTQDGVTESVTTTQTVDILGRVEKTVSPNGNGSETLHDVFGRTIEQARFGATGTGGEAARFVVSTTSYVEAREQPNGVFPARTETISYNYDEDDGLTESTTRAVALLDGHGRPTVTASRDETGKYRITGQRRGVFAQEVTTWSDSLPLVGIDNTLANWQDLGSIPAPLNSHLVGWGRFDGLGETQESWTLDSGAVQYSYPEPGMAGTGELHTGTAGAGPAECHRSEEKLLVHDHRGRLVEVREGTGAFLGGGLVTGTYTHDPSGRLTGFVNGIGDSLTYVRDGVGRVRQVLAHKGADADQEWLSYTYSEAIAQPTQLDTRSGATMAWAYDDLGRTVEQVVSGRSGDETTAWTFDGQWFGAVDTVTFPSHHGTATLSYTYDEHAGTLAYGREGWATTETLSLPDGAGGSTDYTFAYEHDPQGRVVSADWPTYGGHSLTVDTTYASTGKPSHYSVKTNTGGALGFDLTYDAYGSLATWATSAGSDWNLDGSPDQAMGGIDRQAPRKIESMYWSIEGSLHAVDYDYCGDDDVLFARHYDQAGVPQSFQYDYDSLNRIVEVQHSGLGSIEAYSYDAANDPLTSRVGATAPSRTFSYGEGDLFTGSDGVTGSNFGYDMEDRLNSITLGASSRSFVYDSASRVVQATRMGGPGSATTDYWYGPDAQIHEEVTTGGPGGSVHRFRGFRVIDGTSYAQVLPWLTLRDGQLHYTLTEPDERAAMVLDDGGAAVSERYVSAYGEELFASGPAWPTHGLHGAEPDGLMGVAHFGARHMSMHGGGLWLQREPLLRTGGIAEMLDQPRSFSGSYANANPLVFQDKSGQHPILIFLAKEAATEAGIRVAYAVDPRLGVAAEIGTALTSPVQAGKQLLKLTGKAGFRYATRQGTRQLISMAPDVARQGGAEAVTEAAEQAAKTGVEKAAKEGSAKASRARKPPNTANYQLRSADGTFKQTSGGGEVVSGGTSPGRRLSFPEQQKVHTEGKILEATEGSTRPGDILTIQGREPVCSMCDKAMKSAAEERKIKITYDDAAGGKFEVDGR